jgi:integrase
MDEHHELMGGKLHLYRRENSRKWQCSTFLAGKNWRQSTKEDTFGLARAIAEDWYLELKGKMRGGELKVGKTFRDAAAKFLPEYTALTYGERSPKYVDGIGIVLRAHLLPFLGDKLLSEITPGLVQDYRIYRMTSRVDKNTGEIKRPARSTLQFEIVVLRQVLKTANRRGWLLHLPDLSAPYKSSGKIGHRAWFSPDEYKRLYAATRARAKNPKNERWRRASENLHDYVLFMANTGLRPDEAARLEFRDVAIVTDESTGERILEIEVRGKRGVGYCKSMPGAVTPFMRLTKRNKAIPTDRVFGKGKSQRELLNNILRELGLKVDRDGHRRTAYSLRHTYICLRLMEGADIYQIAKNCRTSVEMIEKFYASHIKNTLDAATINVRKSKPKGKRRVQVSQPTDKGGS